MATVHEPLIHWFPYLGFRPVVWEKRTDFAGKIGEHTFAIVADDADIPYSAKFDFIKDYALPSSVIQKPLPSVGPLPVAKAGEYPRLPWGQDIWCCGSHHTHPDIPEIPLPPVAIPGSGLLLLAAVLSVLTMNSCLRRKT